MTDCGCDKAKAELEEYLHRELTDQDFQDVSDHLANCEDCTTEHIIGRKLTDKEREACQEKAPDELAEAIRSRLATA